MNVYVLCAILASWTVTAETGCDCNCNCQPKVTTEESCCPKKASNPCHLVMSDFEESFKHDPALATISARGLCVARNFVLFVSNSSDPKFLAIRDELQRKGEWRFINVPLTSSAPFPIRGADNVLDMSKCGVIDELVVEALKVLPKGVTLIGEEVAMLKMFLDKYKECPDDEILKKLWEHLNQYKKYYDILINVVELIIQ